MADILLGKLMEKNVNPVFRDLKGICDGIGYLRDELFLLLRGSPRQQVDVDGWHRRLLSSEGFLATRFGKSYPNEGAVSIQPVRSEERRY